MENSDDSSGLPTMPAAGSVQPTMPVVSFDSPTAVGPDLDLLNNNDEIVEF